MNFDAYQKKAKETAVYRMATFYPALGLCGEVGEVAEQVKKLIRDDDGALTAARKKSLKAELGDVLWYVANLAGDLGLSLQEVAEDNIKKLASRKERGVLKGDGDER